MPVAQCVGATCLVRLLISVIPPTVVLPSALMLGEVLYSTVSVIRVSGPLQRPNRILPYFCRANKALKTAASCWQTAVMRSLSSRSALTGVAGLVI